MLFSAKIKQLTNDLGGPEKAATALEAHRIKLGRKLSLTEQVQALKNALDAQAAHSRTPAAAVVLRPVAPVAPAARTILTGSPSAPAPAKAEKAGGTPRQRLAASITVSGETSAPVIPRIYGDSPQDRLAQKITTT